MGSINSLNIDVNVTQADIDFVWAKIREFNTSTGPMSKYPPYEPYSVLLKDQNNNIVAGIITRLYLKAMCIEVFWIDEQYRRRGIGSELLGIVENYARKMGCIFIHLDTFSFQAIDFYKKCGYSVFAVIDDYPDNIKRYYLKKYL
jgi:GNAT superfamily N-acetyltransferase